MDEHVVTPDYPPAVWPEPVGSQPSICTCPVPLPQPRATWKGTARTYCGRCDLPVRLDFDPR